MSKINNVDEFDFQKLSVGSEGSMVIVVQKMFNFIGYELVEDGLFGDNMEQVVIDFQTKSSILVADGVVDSDTMVELDTAIELERKAS